MDIFNPIRSNLIKRYQLHQTPEEFQDLVREEKELIEQGKIEDDITPNEIYIYG